VVFFILEQKRYFANWNFKTGVIEPQPGYAPVQAKPKEPRQGWLSRWL
jgi:hypothetical protein